ncbi:hypothetical protein PPL_06664 [Heterostelium album PN500]|uniref:Uncharacterized protein n=1 Tax=Heterostelium pallidum (strain ATCC 26659 / Pp 5 / PN500) TaxID=670386 RepID=D3BFD1_HETP5|nr:hypothetical protein PPL_06664 [Heterostelium album PN500]EFA79845.1 hypothetical protein PPL_06664 [Heterostelium album PN500]|eukprot:XP_020431966.1 hypothetical protein PPL_06664 [Heterostelium album PN500]
MFNYTYFKTTLLLLVFATTAITSLSPSEVLTLRYSSFSSQTNINVTSLDGGDVVGSGLVNNLVYSALPSGVENTVMIFGLQNLNFVLFTFNYQTFETQQVGEYLDIKSFGFQANSFGYEPSLELVMNLEATNEQLNFISWDFKNNILNVLPLDVGAQVTPDTAVGCYDGKSNYYIVFGERNKNSTIISYDIFGKGLSPVQYVLLNSKNQFFYSIFSAVSYSNNQVEQLYGVEIVTLVNDTTVYTLYAIELDSSSSTATTTFLHEVYSTDYDSRLTPFVTNSQSIVFYTIDERQRLVTTVVRLANLQTTVYPTSTDFYNKDVSMFLP